MRAIAIVEARMGSTRLAGKTLMDVAGKPLLQRCVNRLAMARTVSEVVVATSVNPKDDAIALFCAEHAIPCFRGSEDDVLGRVYGAALAHPCDIIVQSGADCPFYDPDLVDMLVHVCHWGGYAYAANDMKLTFPEGIDAHVMTFDALAASATEATTAQEREDTPRFIWNHPQRFPIFNIEAQPGSKFHRPDIRLTVDYPEDMELTRRIYQTLGETFTTEALLACLAQHPDWITLNAHCEQHSAAYL
jgi:spore coat polysaccharide biosynthesis protein SpsF (cytidylyltransferase family)